jgi:ribosomal-protein-alanine N-acetyltransferase
MNFVPESGNGCTCRTIGKEYMCLCPEGPGVTTTVPAPSADCRIRRAVRADLLTVYRIEQAAFPQPWPFGAFEQYVGQPGFLVAEGESVLGYVVADTITEYGRQMGHIKDLAVHESHRRRGVGRALLVRAIRVLDAEDVAAIKLEVREGNDAAIDLYRQHGFEHRTTIREYYSNGEDALVLVREC